MDTKSFSIIEIFSKNLSKSLLDFKTSSFLIAFFALSKLSKIATFEGYLDKQASNKKIMTDVMEDGDNWFNSGDLLTRHENNWLSFADRVGDTYRWKSENVSTMEVAAIINKYPEVLDSNVYGVEVESADGRAGMALMNVSEDFDFEVFVLHRFGVLKF